MCDECENLRRRVTALEAAARAFVECPIGVNRVTLAALVNVDLPEEYDAYRQQVAEWNESKRKALAQGDGN